MVGGRANQIAAPTAEQYVLSDRCTWRFASTTAKQRPRAYVASLRLKTRRSNSKFFHTTAWAGLSATLGFHMATQTDFVCKFCQSSNRRAFDAEIAIHFPGLDGLDKAAVWVFPSISVCLNCGVSEFTVPKQELQGLKTRESVEGHNSMSCSSHRLRLR